MDFISHLQQQLTNSPANLSVTENGAVGYKSTGRALMDLNFAVSSLRKATEKDIQHKFAAALAEEGDLAIVWLFFVRDVRGGLGERRLFRICMHWLAEQFRAKTIKLLPLIAEYGRWDDLIDLLDTKVSGEVQEIIKKQLTQDINDQNEGKSISLLAKWMPSENASSPDTKLKAQKLRMVLGMTPRTYRLVLSKLRKYIGVLERKMSAGEWDDISYEGVPSRANLKYNSAFLRHDETRRREFLGKLEKGEAKINASTLFPHDIVHKYGLGLDGVKARIADPALEAMWKSLPDAIQDDGSTIVVADGSGSMSCKVDTRSSVTALEVANALAIYFAERLKGQYHDKYITFSENPKLVNLGGASNLHGKLNIAAKHNEVANTNIEAVFDLILNTAVNNGMKQEELPRNILIISDMEFDACAVDNSYTSRVWGYSGRRMNGTLFDMIKQKYERHGYKLPRLVFWNVNSRTGTIPVKENDMGVALVSGFSPNVAKMVMSGSLDPRDALMETLSAERYDAVRKALSLI